MTPINYESPERPSRWYVVAPDGTVICDFPTRREAEAELLECPSGSWIEED